MAQIPEKDVNKWIDVALDEEWEIMNIIQDEILTDDYDDSYHLLNMYRNANDKEREIIDKTLICICGWSFKTLLEKAKEHALDEIDHELELFEEVCNG